MKKSITFTLLAMLMQVSTALCAEVQDSTCTNSAAYDLADQAKQEYKKMLNDIAGVMKIEVETCSEDESYGVTADNWQCGVFVWFADDEKREQFHQTTSLWGGKLKLANGSSVAVCSKTSQQLMSRGPY